MVKKLLQHTLVVFLLTTYSQLLQAQSSFSVAGGLGISNLEGFSHSSFSGMLNVNYGLELSDRFQLIGKVGYTDVGDRLREVFETEPNEEVIQKTNQRIQFLDIGIDTRTMIGDRFYIVAGPYLGIKLRSQYLRKVKQTTNGVSTETEFAEDITNLFTKADFGITLGIGAPLGDRLSAELIFQQGAINIFNWSSLDLDYKRQLLTLGVNWVLWRN